MIYTFEKIKGIKKKVVCIDCGKFLEVTNLQQKRCDLCNFRQYRHKKHADILKKVTV